MSHRIKLFGPSSDAENKVLNWNDDNNLISIMISKELQNVIKAMLKFNPTDRKSAKDYLQMEFFKKYPKIQSLESKSNDILVKKSIVEKIDSNQTTLVLQKIAGMFMSNQIEG